MESQEADRKREDDGKRDWQNTSTTRWQGSRPSARHQAAVVASMDPSGAHRRCRQQCPQTVGGEERRCPRIAGERSGRDVDPDLF
jgi:hypothetical protein